MSGNPTKATRISGLLFEKDTLLYGKYPGLFGECRVKTWKLISGSGSKQVNTGTRDSPKEGSRYPRILVEELAAPNTEETKGKRKEK